MRNDKMATGICLAGWHPSPEGFSWGEVQGLNLDGGTLSPYFSQNKNL